MAVSQIYEMVLEGQFFTAVRGKDSDGNPVTQLKTVEGRLAKGKYSVIKADDYFKVYRKGDQLDYFMAKVEAVISYESFEDMLVNEGFTNVLPGFDEETGEEEYWRIYGNVLQGLYNMTVDVVGQEGLSEEERVKTLLITPIGKKAFGLDSNQALCVLEKIREIKDGELTLRQKLKALVMVVGVKAYRLTVEEMVL